MTPRGEGRPHWQEGGLAHALPGSPRTGAWVTAWVRSDLSTLHAVLSMVTCDPAGPAPRPPSLSRHGQGYMGAAMLAQARPMERSCETRADEDRENGLERQDSGCGGIGSRGEVWLAAAQGTRVGGCGPGQWCAVLYKF